MTLSFRLFLLVLLVAKVIFSQEENKLDSSEPWENIHLHLNKTTFIKGEKLWFAAYVQNQNSKKPSFSTANLHVAIKDSKGETFKEKLFHVKNGKATGDFSIDSTFVDKAYSVIAWTNFMRNFKNLGPFQQGIKVLQNKGEETADIEKSIQLEIYPEGGYLVSGVFNQIGIRTINESGQGIGTDGLELIDETGRTIQSNIRTNSLGLGKTGFMVEPNKSYALRFSNRGKTVTVQLENALENTVGLSLENIAKNAVFIKLIYNVKTFEYQKGETYSIAIYQNDNIHFEDLVIDANNPVIAIDRQLLPHGVNTVVLLNEDLLPISRRMFFNHREDQERVKNVAVDIRKHQSNDSIQLDIEVLKHENVVSNLSVSVLPSGTIAYQPSSSLASSFLIHPYCNKDFSDGFYYFDGMDRKKRFELDTRMLIEGWGRYEWEPNKLRQIKLKFEKETRISITGKIPDADLVEEQQVYFVTDRSGSMMYTDLQNDKSFSADMVLYKGDSLGVSVINKKGKLRKPNVEIQIGETLAKSYDWKFKRNHPGTGEPENKESLISLGNNAIFLDEVIVTKVKKRQNKFQITADFEGKIVTDDDIKRIVTLENYIRKLGFRISHNGQRYSANGDPLPPGLEIKMSRYPWSIIPIYIDGYYNPNDAVFNLPLTSVESVIYRRGSWPYINVKLKSERYVSPKNRNNFAKFLIQNGYSRPQEYFDPGYQDYNSNLFESYGAIAWWSNLSINNDAPLSISMPTMNQKAFNVYIEGMDENGSIISFSKKIEWE